MENTSHVIQGLTLLTESLVLPNVISRYLAINFDTISRTALLFENLIPIPVSQAQAQSQLLDNLCSVEYHF